MTKKDSAPLFFVVRDIETPASTEGEKKRIQSHISQSHRRWKKTARIPALHSSTQAILKNPLITPPATTSTASSSYPTPSQSPSPERLVEDRVPTAFPVDVAATVHAGGPARGPLKTRVASSHCGRFVTEFASPWRQLDYGELRVQLPPILPATDPFTSTFAFGTAEVQSLLHLYFKIIKPFAQSLISSWVMFDDIGLLQQSPALTYAIASYASAFLSGLKKGGPGVVLPPPAKPGQAPLWPVPPWLKLHTRCLNELNKSLAAQGGRYDDATYQTILFLFRLSVLLSDGQTGRMHMDALNQVRPPTSLGSDPLPTELAVSKVNIISAYFVRPSVVIQKSSTSDHCVVDIDRRYWIDESEWVKFQGALLGRQLLWRSKAPDSTVLPDTHNALTRMDPQYTTMEASMSEQLALAYQTGLYLITYMNIVNFQPSAPHIRSNLFALEKRLSAMDIPLFRSFCPNGMFNILLSGAFSSLGYLNRNWFVTKLAQDFQEVKYMNEVLQTLGKFVDTWSTRLSLVEDVWSDVLEVRAKKANVPRESLKLYDEAWKIGPKQIRPCTYSPNISAPAEIVELQQNAIKICSRRNRLVFDYISPERLSISGASR